MDNNQVEWLRDDIRDVKSELKEMRETLIDVGSRVEEVSSKVEHIQDRKMKISLGDWKVILMLIGLLTSSGFLGSGLQGVSHQLMDYAMNLNPEVVETSAAAETDDDEDNQTYKVKEK